MINQGCFSPRQQQQARAGTQATSSQALSSALPGRGMPENLYSEYGSPTSAEPQPSHHDRAIWVVWFWVQWPSIQNQASPKPLKTVHLAVGRRDASVEQMLMTESGQRQKCTHSFGGQCPCHPLSLSVHTAWYPSVPAPQHTGKASDGDSGWCIRQPQTTGGGGQATAGLC